MSSTHQTAGRGLGKRLLAALVLLVAAWLALKVVVGFVTAIAWTAAVVVALIAVIWAIRTL